jgi:hypothetical protein
LSGHDQAKLTRASRGAIPEQFQIRERQRRSRWRYRDSFNTFTWPGLVRFDFEDLFLARFAPQRGNLLLIESAVPQLCKDGRYR